MDRRKLLLAAAVAAVMMAAAPPLSAAALPAMFTCTLEQTIGGDCAGAAPIEVTPGLGGGGLNLGATVTLPGGPSASNGVGGAGPRTPRVKAPTCVPPAICRDGYTVTMPLEGRGPVTLADLVNFRPVVGVHRMEPSGWMVVGLDTNFYIDGGTQVQDGLLLDVPASVRFTPASYTWTYGDGDVATRATGGASWQALGLGEFSPTLTSHIFRTAGTFQIGAIVTFRAEYRFGPGEWTPIEGTLPVPSAPLIAVASDADTVLVAEECTIRPSGPGC